MEKREALTVVRTNCIIEAHCIPTNEPKTFLVKNEFPVCLGFAEGRAVGERFSVRPDYKVYEIDAIFAMGEQLHTAPARKTVPENHLNCQKNPCRFPLRFFGTSCSKVSAPNIQKKAAMELLRRRGYSIPTYPLPTFASKNKTQDYYWSNPDVRCLGHKWTLILSDWKHRILYLFQIPKNAISEEDVRLRKDKDGLISLEINYPDPSFRDTVSGYSFAPYLVDAIGY